MTSDAEARQLLADAGLPDRSLLIDGAAAYLRRTRQGRRYGLIGGLVLALGPLADTNLAGLVLPWMLVGYVLGLLASEWLAPRRERPARRAADLRVRRAADLLPRWARATVWVLFIPALASPLLTLVHPVRGLTHVRSYGYRCDSAGLRLPGLSMLVASAAIGAAGLLVAQLTLARLARRPRPADDPDTARLDDVLRGMSARAVAGGAAALALALASMLSAEVDEGIHGFVCSAQPGPPVAAYPWAASLAPWLQWVPLGLLGAAVMILAVCRCRHDPRHRHLLGAAR